MSVLPPTKGDSDSDTPRERGREGETIDETNELSIILVDGKRVTTVILLSRTRRCLRKEKYL